MIIFISDKQIQRNFKKAGYNNIGSGVTELVNKAAYNYVRKEINRVIKNNKNIQALEAHHFEKQNGGRVLMPSEYYGVASNHYVEITGKTDNGTDMAVKESWIRPSFKAELNGGEAPKFTLSRQSVKNIASEVINTNMKSAIIIKQDALKTIHSNLVSKLSELTKTLERKVKSESLQKQDLSSVLSMTKYKAMM